MRGALRTSRNARWDAVDAELAKDERKRPRTAKPCGPDTPTLVSSCAEVSAWRRWQESPVTGESAEETVTPSRREGRIASAEPVCSCASFYVQLAHETAGAACTRSSLRPLPLTRAKVQANLGHIMPRECGITSSRCLEKHEPDISCVIARSDSDETIHASARVEGCIASAFAC
jgi:hypothetical protein